MGEGVRLTLIQTHKPERIYAGKPLECSCGSRTVQEVRIGVTIKNGKASAGQKQLRCAECKKTLWG